MIKLGMVALIGWMLVIPGTASRAQIAPPEPFDPSMCFADTPTEMGRHMKSPQELEEEQKELQKFADKNKAVIDKLEEFFAINWESKTPPDLKKLEGLAQPSGYRH